MKRPAIGAVVAGSALLLSGLSAGAQAVELPAAQTTAAKARVWVTTPDRDTLTAEPHDDLREDMLVLGLVMALVPQAVVCGSSRCSTPGVPRRVRPARSWR